MKVLVIVVAAAAAGLRKMWCIHYDWNCGLWETNFVEHVSWEARSACWCRKSDGVSIGATSNIYLDWDEKSKHLHPLGRFNQGPT